MITAVDARVMMRDDTRFNKKLNQVLKHIEEKIIEAAEAGKSAVAITLDPDVWSDVPNGDKIRGRVIYELMQQGFRFEKDSHNQPHGIFVCWYTNMNERNV